MAKEMIINVTVPEGYSAGDTFQVKVVKKSRVIERKDINDMTYEELKREIVNAKSCLYKRSKTGSDVEEAQARVDAAVELLSTKFASLAGPVKKAGGASVYASTLVEEDDTDEDFE